MTEITKPEVKAEEITMVYVGGDRVCRCGCAGTYFEKGEPGFERRVKRFMKLWADYTPDGDDVGDNYRNITTAEPRGRNGTGRAITAYIN